jgi:hypothetical protein
MTRAGISTGELEAIVERYHHLQEEHRRAGAEGSVRRHLHARLLELEEDFERLLAEWVSDESARGAWRRHLHHGAPAPAQPGEARPALVFRGRSAAGSFVEVHERLDGDYDVSVDGSSVERIGRAPDFAAATPRLVFRLGDLEFGEVLDASAPARAALRAHVAAPAGEPPWQYATELIADGLIDRDFGLTPRGRRALTA